MREAEVSYRPGESIRDRETYFSINLVLLVLALLLDHEDRMIEEEDLKLCTLTLRSSSFLERSFVDEFSFLVS